MNRYLILGNGFDLAHNLPTSYKDFLFVCAEYIELNHTIRVKNENIDKVKNGFIRKYKDDSNFKRLVKNNFWLKNFFNKLENIGDNWIDFEIEIKNQCESLAKNINHTFIDLGSNKVSLNDLKESLRELIYILNRYLVIVNKIEIDECYLDVINFMPTHIINFNYTNTFSRAYKKLEIDYIHGSIDNQDNSTIVLGFEGMNDEKRDIEFGEFLKYIQMVQNDITIDCYAEMQKTNNNESTFFGHSLDETDKDIIMKIIECSSRVNILYKDNDMKKSIIKNLIKIYGRKDFVTLTLSKDKKINFIEQSNSQVGKKEDIELIYAICQGKAEKLLNKFVFGQTSKFLFDQYKINMIPIETLYNYVVKQEVVSTEYLYLLNYCINRLEKIEELSYRSKRERNLLIRKMIKFTEEFDEKRIKIIA